MKNLGEALFMSMLFAGAFFLGGYDSKVGTLIAGNSMGASVFFTQSTTSADLQNAFNTASSTNKKLKILIVPGHEPDFGGAEYRDVKERDLNADLALSLAQYLVEDGHYEVTMTRGKDGWNPQFENYFATHAEEIKAFVSAQKQEMARLVEEGKVVTKSDKVPHNDAPDDVALRLFGINKWANEHNIDIVIHVHFNDNVPRKVNTPGEHNGFTIYTPEHQYSNAQPSADIAQYVFKRLSKMFPVSSLPGEDSGVVEDQSLIALGSSNSVDSASILIEYGYIYEPQFKTPSVRAVALKELAFQTYLGLADFFKKPALSISPHESTLLPYEGKKIVKKTTNANKEVFALQAALADKGFYPPENYSKNDCPLSGLFGPCTQSALAQFQNEFSIKGEKGIVGTKTRAELHNLFQPNILKAR